MMAQCPHCRRALPALLESCPHCTSPSAHAVRTLESVEADEGAAWVAVARFANVAEAGYFAHEMTAEDSFDLELVAQDGFDALTGAWRTEYLLRAPQATAPQVAARLRSMLDGQPADLDLDPGNAGEEWGLGDTADESPGVSWIPLLLTLAAGSLVFWGAREWRADPQRVHARQAHPLRERDLWERLGSERAPWVQQLENGTGRRELHILPASKTAILREDSEGDGVFEIQQEFRWAGEG